MASTLTAPADPLIDFDSHVDLRALLATEPTVGGGDRSLVHRWTTAEHSRVARAEDPNSLRTASAVLFLRTQHDGARAFVGEPYRYVTTLHGSVYTRSGASGQYGLRIVGGKHQVAHLLDPVPATRLNRKRLQLRHRDALAALRDLDPDTALGCVASRRDPDPGTTTLRAILTQMLEQLQTWATDL